jgi:TolB-like protein
MITLGAMLVVALQVGIAPAPARLLEEVDRDLAAVRARRLAESTAKARAADAAVRTAERELDKARARLRRAEEKLAAIAAAAPTGDGKERDKQRRARDEARRTRYEAAKTAAAARATAAERSLAEAKAARDAAPDVAEAARALAAAAAALDARQKIDVAPAVEKAAADPELRRAARALTGLAAELRGDDKAALAAFDDEILKAYPSARRHRGLVRARSGDGDGAFADLRAVELAPSDLVAHRALARLAAARNDHELAREHFAALYAADPVDPDAAVGLVRALLGLGRPADAIGPLVLLASDSSNREANYLLGLASERANEPLRAEIAFANVVGGAGARGLPDPSYARPQRAIRVVPLPPPWTEAPPAKMSGDRADVDYARVRLAWYRLQRGLPDLAVAALDKIDRPDGLYVRALARMRLGDRTGARADLERALERDPQRAAARLALGAALLELGDTDGAAKAFATAGGEAGGIGEALARASTPGVDEKEVEAALSRLALLAASAKDPAVADAAATDRAALLRARGVRDACRGLPPKPRTAEGWAVRGHCLADGNDQAGAAAAYREAAALAASYTDAHLGLARALEGKDDSGAERSARRALELAPDLVEARSVLARVYDRRGDAKKKAAELQKIREIGERVAGAAGKKRALAVVAFENHSSDKSLDWMCHGVAEALVSDLGKLGALTIIERTQVQKTFQEQRLSELGFAESPNATKIGKLLGADALLVGQFTKSGGQLRLDGRVIEVGSTRVLKTGSAVGPADKLFEIERRLAIDLLEEYAAVTDKERAELFSAKGVDLHALEALGKVRLLATSSRPGEAKAEYEKLLREDPKLAEKVKEMQKSWENAASVAVTPLANASGRPDEAWMGVGIAEALTTDLRKMGLFLVERQQVERLMQERRLTELFNEEEAVKLGKLAGASFLVVGSYQIQGPGLRVDVRLVDVGGGQVLRTWTVEGKADQLFDVEARLVAKIAEALKVDAADVAKAALTDGVRPSLEDFKRYIQASSKLLVKPAAPREVRVSSIAVGPFHDAQSGADDEPTRAGVERALAMANMMPVSAAKSVDPKAAGADVLVIGSKTPFNMRVRIDARALAPDGEVLATATTLGALGAEQKTYVALAQNLLLSLGVGASAPPAKAVVSSPPTAAPVAPAPPPAPPPTVAKRRNLTALWVTLGVLVGAGAVGAGLGVGLTRQSVPSADITLTAR